MCWDRADDFVQSIFVKCSRPHHCHRLTFQPSTHANTSLGQRSLTRRRGPISSLEKLGELLAVVVHIVLVKFWHLSLSSSTGKFSENSVVDFLRGLWLAVLHKFCSRIVMVSTATSRIGPPTSTTRNLNSEKHILQVSAQDPHAMLSCSCQKRTPLRAFG